MYINRCQEREKELEYYTVVKNVGILPLGRKCLKLEKIMPSEMQRDPRDNYGAVSLLGNVNY